LSTEDPVQELGSILIVDLSAVKSRAAKTCRVESKGSPPSQM